MYADMTNDGRSQESLEHFLAHELCIFVTYLHILLSLVIFAYVTDEGHRSDQNVLVSLKTF